MRLHLGGHLNWYDAEKRARFEIDLRAPTTLRALLHQVGVPPAEIAIAAINGALVEIESARVSNSDRVDLYPPVGGGI